MAISGGAQPILPNAIAQVVGASYTTVVASGANVKGVYINEYVSRAGNAHLRIGGSTEILDCARYMGGSAPVYGGLKGWVIPAGQSVEIAGAVGGVTATLNYRIL